MTKLKTRNKRRVSRRLKKRNTRRLSRKRIKRNTRRNVKNGGKITAHSLFENIESIGFEIETTDIVKFTITPSLNEEKNILVNSALTNIDLEYGFEDKNEYTDIIKEPNVSFKVTNDSAEDDYFNSLLQEIRVNHDCDEDIPFFRLKIKDNTKTQLQDAYNIYVRETDESLTACSTFTDTEFIATYYKPEKSQNVILNYFFKSFLNLKEHINKLKPITTSLVYLTEDEATEEATEDKATEDEEYKENDIIDIAKQSYYLPETTLLYVNISEQSSNYNIVTDLAFVPQMTFSCNIIYIYNIMNTLMELSSKQIQNCSTRKEIECGKLNDVVAGILSEDNNDKYAIETAFKMSKELIEDYDKKTDKKIDFEQDEETKSKIVMYLFLILYKLFIYINAYIPFRLKGETHLLKKNLSFAVRHDNYSLYVNIKKCIKNMLKEQNELNNKDDTELNTEAIEIIQDILNNNKIIKKIYFNPYIKKERLKMSNEMKTAKNTDATKYEMFKQNYFGDPLYSILIYFKYFENQQNIDSGVRDWLVIKDIDSKSTKFDLENDKIIVEFRDFPTYMYLYLFDTGSANVKEQLLTKNIGTINMKIINDYMSDNYMTESV